MSSHIIRTGLMAMMLMGLVWAGPGDAIEYAYVSIDVPFDGATNTRVMDVNTIMTMVGTYQDPSGSTFGWVLNPLKAKFTALKHKRCIQVLVSSVARNGNIAGTCWYIPWGGVKRAFLRIGTNWNFFVVPNALETEGVTVSDNGLFVGTFTTASNHLRQSFIFNFATKAFEVIEFAPGSLETIITGITNTGDLGGYVSDTTTHQGWVEFDGIVNPYFPPDPSQQSSQVRDIGMGRSLVGAFWNGIGINSFADLGGDYTDIHVPGATNTQVEGFAENWVSVGAWMDDNGQSHGFVAIPQGRASDAVAGLVERAKWVANRYGAHMDVGK